MPGRRPGRSRLRANPFCLTGRTNTESRASRENLDPLGGVDLVGTKIACGVLAAWSMVSVNENLGRSAKRQHGRLHVFA